MYPQNKLSTKDTTPANDGTEYAYIHVDDEASVPLEIDADKIASDSISSDASYTDPYLSKSALENAVEEVAPAKIGPEISEYLDALLKREEHYVANWNYDGSDKGPIILEEGYARKIWREEFLSGGPKIAVGAIQQSNADLPKFKCAFLFVYDTDAANTWFNDQVTRGNAVAQHVKWAYRQVVIISTNNTMPVDDMTVEYEKSDKHIVQIADLAKYKNALLAASKRLIKEIKKA